MAGKCDRNECGIVWYPTGIPHLYASSLMTSCRIQFTLDGSIFTREDSMNKEQFNHRVPTSVFLSPACRKMEWKGRGKKMKEGETKRKSCERNYSKVKECLIYTWTVNVECKAKCVCVCDKTGLSESFILRKIEEKGPIFQCNHSVSLILFFMLKNHKQLFLPVLFSYCIVFILSQHFLRDSPLDLRCFFWFCKCMNSLREQVGSWSCLFVDCLDSNPS